MNLFDKMSLIFNRRSTKELKISVDAISNCLNTVNDDLNLLNLEYVLGTSTGIWLNYWGSWFGIPRIYLETDSAYSSRILYTIRKNKISPNAFIEATRNMLGSQVNVELYEPYADLAKFDISTFSGSSKFLGGSYYEYCIADLKVYDTDITPELVKEINSIKAAGIYVYFTHSLQLGIVDNTPDDPVDSKENIIIETGMYAGNGVVGIYNFSDLSTINYPISGNQSLFLDNVINSQLQSLDCRIVFPGSTVKLADILTYTPYQLDTESFNIQTPFEVTSMEE